MKNNKVLLTVIVCALLTSNVSAQIKTDIYGFVKANIAHSSSALNSFNSINFSAPTSAANRSVLNSVGITDKSDRTSFQVQQSRFGLKIKKSDKTNALIELDFIDFSKSSPTTQSRPRLRRAFIEQKLTANISLRLGQDWG